MSSPKREVSHSAKVRSCRRRAAGTYVHLRSGSRRQRQGMLFVPQLWAEARASAGVNLRKSCEEARGLVAKLPRDSGLQNSQSLGCSYFSLAHLKFAPLPQS